MYTWIVFAIVGIITALLLTPGEGYDNKLLLCMIFFAVFGIIGAVLSYKAVKWFSISTGFEHNNTLKLMPIKSSNFNNPIFFLIDDGDIYNYFSGGVSCGVEKKLVKFLDFNGGGEIRVFKNEVVGWQKNWFLALPEKKYEIYLPSENGILRLGESEKEKKGGEAKAEKSAFFFFETG